MRTKEGYWHEVVSSDGSFIRKASVGQHFSIQTYTPDFSGVSFAKASGRENHLSLLVQLKDLPAALLFRWKEDLPDDRVSNYGLTWLAADGSRFVAMAGGELAFFQRERSSLRRELITGKAHAYGAFGDEVYYSEADVPETLRRVSIGDPGSPAVIYRAPLPFDTIVLAGPDATYLVACLRPADRLSLEDCRIIDLKTGQSRDLPVPRNKHIGEIVSLGTTSQVILHVWSGRELLDGSSLNEFHLVDLQTGESTWSFDNLKHYNVHSLQPVR